MLSRGINVNTSHPFLVAHQPGKRSQTYQSALFVCCHDGGTRQAAMLKAEGQPLVETTQRVMVWGARDSPPPILLAYRTKKIKIPSLMTRYCAAMMMGAMRIE